MDSYCGTIRINCGYELQQIPLTHILLWHMTNGEWLRQFSRPGNNFIKSAMTPSNSMCWIEVKIQRRQYRTRLYNFASYDIIARNAGELHKENAWDWVFNKPTKPYISIYWIWRMDGNGSSITSPMYWQMPHAWNTYWWIARWWFHPYWWTNCVLYALPLMSAYGERKGDSTSHEWRI